MITKSTRRLLAATTTLGAVVPIATVASAGPAHAYSSCVAGSDRQEMSVSIVRQANGTEIGRVGLYYSPSTNCWEGTVAVKNPVGATAILYTGGANAASCYVPAGQKACVTAGRTGDGSTYTLGNMVGYDGNPYLGQTSVF